MCVCRNEGGGGKLSVTCTNQVVVISKITKRAIQQDHCQGAKMEGDGMGGGGEGRIFSIML